MNLVLAIFVVVGFATGIEYLNLPTYAREVGRRNKDCLTVLRDTSLSDDEKEDALQRQARRLCVLLGILVGGSLLALGGPLALIWLLEQGGIGSLGGVLAILQRLDFLAGTAVVGVLTYLLLRSLRQT